MSDAPPIESSVEQSSAITSVREAERNLSRLESSEGDRPIAPSSTEHRLENELKESPAPESVAKAEANYRRLERFETDKLADSSKPIPELQNYLDKLKATGTEIDSSRLDMPAINKVMAYDNADYFLNTVDRSDLSAAERADLLNHNAELINTWGGDKQWLVQNAEMLEYLDEIDLNTFGPEQQRVFTELAKHYGSTADVAGLLELATELESPQEAARYLTGLTGQIDAAKHIRGMDDVINEIAHNTSPTAFKGTQFELEWISANADNPKYPIREVALAELRDGRVTKSVDVMLENDTAVELKSYKEYNNQATIDSFQTQLERAVTERGAKDAVLVLDTREGPLSPSATDKLNRMVEQLSQRHPTNSFRWETYP